MEQLKEMQKILDEMVSDIESLSQERKVKKKKVSVPKERINYLETVVRSECSEIKKMISKIDNQVIADSVSKMVVNQIISPLQEAIESAIKGPEKSQSIGQIAEDMKRKVEKLSERHIRVIGCLTQAKGEWVNYNSLSSICGVSQSCIRGYISDLKHVYEIPVETSNRGGKTFIRIDPKTVRKLAFGYQAAKLNSA